MLLRKNDMLMFPVKLSENIELLFVDILMNIEDNFT